MMALLIGTTGGANAMTTEKAIFAGGCFWCMQAEFEGTEGVASVTSGYTGGFVKDPTYEQVSAGTTGHAEAILITYDPDRVGYEKLLQIYWGNIDPTDQGGQFYDRGSQYRTGIYYFNHEQRELAELSKKKVEEKLKKPVYTEITAASDFYPAEDYHQQYYKKNPIRYKAYSRGHESGLKEIWGKTE